ncbi:MAG: hypothetical protein N2C12_15590, partial [Planctomycetales bacterium]
MKRLDDLEQAVLNFISAKGYRPVKPRKIARKLGLDEDATRELKRAVKRLVKAGKLAYGENHSVARPGAVADDHITGVFRRNANGYGFVRPQSSNRPAQRDEDIFIPQKKTHDAATGDVVLVRPG